MYPFLAKSLINNLMDFNVPCVDLFKKKVTEIAQEAKATMDLEELASIEKYPSIRPLLKFFHRPLTLCKITCFENWDDITILDHNINDLEGLLTTAREIGKDTFSPQLVLGESPPLVKRFSLLQAAAMKDEIKWTQHNYYRLSFHD
ncbi:hypothetical protein AMTRI_Chr03g48900 [Amborella trichopoda]